VYVDDSTLYTSATTATEMTESIVFGTKHSLNPKAQLNLVISHVEIVQVEMTKLFGVTRDCKLSWSKHIDAVVAKTGRSLSIIKRGSTFLTTLSTRQVLQFCGTLTTV
jgi:phosphoglucomutase